MDQNCYLCKQKQQWLDEKLNLARVAAKEQAFETGETMAIVKQGANYTIVKASELIGVGMEFFSKFG